MDILYLERHNKWWKGKGEINSDFHIVQWNSKKYKWVPKILNEINLDPGSIHIISGPRQVGKTTAMKLLIKRLLENGSKAENIFYLRCDELSALDDLREAFETYESFKEPKGVRYVFLDEITNVENWHGFIKNMYDNGELGKTIIFVTGSNAINIRKGSEYLPGRRGKGKDFLVLPLSFRSFIEVIEPSIAGKIEVLADLSKKEIEKKTKKAYVHKAELEKLFRRYLMCGGFPHPLEEYLTKGAISHEINDIYLSWFVGDIFKSGKSDVVAKQILKALFEKMPSAMSWENIAGDIEIKSPKTVASYVELFQDLHAVCLLYHIDPDRKTVNFAKNKKIHFLDPFLYRLFEHWCLLEIKWKEETMVESMAAISLMRYSFRQTGLERRLNENAFYWKNGYEIDTVINYGKDLFGFEVKWGRVREQSRRLGKIKDVLYLTKNELSFEHPMMVPLFVFLAMLPDKV